MLLHSDNMIAYPADDGRILARVEFCERTKEIVEVTHTIVDPSLRGQGIGDILMSELATVLRFTGRKAMLRCSYARHWFEKHPEHTDLVWMSGRKPVIGITPAISENEDQLSLSRTTMDVLRAMGAIPVILPPTTDEQELADLLQTVDGILFSGGGDIDPLTFGENLHQQCGIVSPLRDQTEIPLARMAIASRKAAVLGICRGCQVLNIAAHGTLWQDLPSQFSETPILHRQKSPSVYPSHPVTIRQGTRLAQIVAQETLLVNSLHHQAVKQPGDGMIAGATAPDGVIESVELPDHPFYLGVQWHPERMWQRDEVSRRIFMAFVEAASELANKT